MKISNQIQPLAQRLSHQTPAIINGLVFGILGCLAEKTQMSLANDPGTSALSNTLFCIALGCYAIGMTQPHRSLIFRRASYFANHNNDFFNFGVQVFSTAATVTASALIMK